MTGAMVLVFEYLKGSALEAGQADIPKGVVMPGTRCGFTSERSIIAWLPLIEPAASSSTVPAADGARVRLPITLMSPEKAVTLSAPGIRPVWNGVCTTPSTEVHVYRSGRAPLF